MNHILIPELKAELRDQAERESQYAARAIGLVIVATVQLSVVLAAKPDNHKVAPWLVALYAAAAVLSVPSVVGHIVQAPSLLAQLTAASSWSQNDLAKHDYYGTITVLIGNRSYLKILATIFWLQVLLIIACLLGSLIAIGTGVWPT